MRPIIYSLLFFIASVPVFVYGQEGKVYSPLIKIQNGGNEVVGFSEYIGFLYGLSISIAALLAVVKIIIAGAKYMLSDVVSTKGDAISDIQGAILGLLLILGAVIILEFINPQLIKRDINFDPIETRPSELNRPSSVAVLIPPNSNITVAPGINACATQRTFENSTVTVFDATKCQGVANVSIPEEIQKFRSWCDQTIKGTITTNGSFIANCTPKTNAAIAGSVNFSVIPVAKTVTDKSIVYVFDSISYANDRTIQFDRETTFKNECTKSKGINSKQGILFVCTISK